MERVKKAAVRFVVWVMQMIIRVLTITGALFFLIPGSKALFTKAEVTGELLTSLVFMAIFLAFHFNGKMTRRKLSGGQNQ